MPGTLYIIGTPIGNLQDFNRRAATAITQCDFLLVEDTRVTIKLLNHFDLKKRLVSCHEHNEKERLALLKEAAQAGKTVGLIADAGLPLISDPGSEIVRAAIDSGMQIVPIPGPSAFLLAIVGSGLDTRRFVFEGFLPDKQGELEQRLSTLSAEERTLVFYVSPHKLKKTLLAIQKVLGDRDACLARELTKIHEEFIREKISVLSLRAEESVARGELVLIVAGRQPGRQSSLTIEELEHVIARRLRQGNTVKDVAGQLAEEFDLRRRDIYKLAVSIAKQLDS